jgi:hypothetical protein
MTDDELIDAYNKANHAYEAAKVGTGCRVAAFATFLAAEKVLTVRLGLGPQLKHYQERYAP